VSSLRVKLAGWDLERRFVVLREKIREDKEAVGRRLLDVPGYTYRVWVTNRTESALEIWRDYNGRATVEQRIEEMKNDLNADGFCTKKFFATEAAFLGVVLSFNLLSLYQAGVTRESGYRKPSTLRTAVFVGGAILGRKGRDVVLRFSESWGSLKKHIPLIKEALNARHPIGRFCPSHRGSERFWMIWRAGGAGFRRDSRQQFQFNRRIRVKDFAIIANGQGKNSASRLARFLLFSANPSLMGLFDSLAHAFSPFGLHSCSLPRACPRRSVVPIC
jgi:hypothetical protein